HLGDQYQRTRSPGELTQGSTQPTDREAVLLLRQGRASGAAVDEYGLGDVPGFDRQVRDHPIEPPREPPVGLAEEVHEGRDQHGSDDEGVDENGAGQADAELLDDDDFPKHEARKDQDQGGGRGGDLQTGSRLTEGHSHAVVVVEEPLLVHPADQEHLVVHGQPEEDGEQQDGNEDLDGGSARDTEQRVSPPPFEDGVHDAEGGADRQEVHDRRDQRDQKASEHGHKQQEGQHDHDSYKERQLRGQDVGKVGLDGGGAPYQDGQAGAGLGLGDDVVAEPVQQRRGRH